MKPKLGDYIIIVSDFNIPLANGTIGKVDGTNNISGYTHIKVIKWGSGITNPESRRKTSYYVTPNDKITIVSKGKGWKERLIAEIL
jgi:hypothetical protein